MKKKIFITVIIIIILFRIITQSDYIYYNSDKIIIYNDFDYPDFTLNIKNHFIERRATLKFACSKDLEDIEKVITEQGYKVMHGKTDESLYIFSDVVYYLYIDKDKSNIFRNRFIYGINQATVSIYIEQISNDAHITFPYNEVISLGTGISEKEEIKCGFKYLKEFYENVETAKVYDDMIDIDAVICDSDAYGNDIILRDKYVRIKYEGDNLISFELLDKE